VIAVNSTSILTPVSHVTWVSRLFLRFLHLVVESLSYRKVDEACIQETQWKGSGCKFYRAKGKRNKLFWMGVEERSDGVGIFIVEKWVDSVVNVERHSKRVLILKID